MTNLSKTMANHAYIDRSGITTFAQAANACQITLGFGYDTCTFLSALGLLAGGDIVSGAYSIGGADARVPNTLGPSLGISKHGFFEVDNSISRQDHYFGNQADFKLDRFNRLTEIANKYGGQFGNSAFAEERVMLYEESKNTNPEVSFGDEIVLSLRSLSADEHLSSTPVSDGWLSPPPSGSSSSVLCQTVLNQPTPTSPTLLHST